MGLWNSRLLLAAFLPHLIWETVHLSIIEKYTCYMKNEYEQQSSSGTKCEYKLENSTGSYIMSIMCDESEIIDMKPNLRVNPRCNSMYYPSDEKLVPKIERFIFNIAITQSQIEYIYDLSPLIKKLSDRSSCLVEKKRSKLSFVRGCYPLIDIQISGRTRNAMSYLSRRNFIKFNSTEGNLNSVNLESSLLWIMLNNVTIKNINLSSRLDPDAPERQVLFWSWISSNFQAARNLFIAGNERLNNIPNKAISGMVNLHSLSIDVTNIEKIETGAILMGPLINTIDIHSSNLGYLQSRALQHETLIDDKYESILSSTSKTNQSFNFTINNYIKSISIKDDSIDLSVPSKLSQPIKDRLRQRNYFIDLSHVKFDNGIIREETFRPLSESSPDLNKRIFLPQVECCQDANRWLNNLSSTIQSKLIFRCTDLPKNISSEESKKICDEQQRGKRVSIIVIVLIVISVPIVALLGVYCYYDRKSKLKSRRGSVAVSSIGDKLRVGKSNHLMESIGSSRNKSIKSVKSIKSGTSVDRKKSGISRPLSKKSTKLKKSHDMSKKPKSESKINPRRSASKNINLAPQHEI